MQLTKLVTLLFLITLLVSSCTRNEWKAQTCDTETMTCSEMSYGPYKTLDNCINNMKKLGIKFTCAQGCRDGICSGEIMRYNVKIEGGATRVIPISK